MPARHKTGANVGRTKKGHQRLAGQKRKGTSGNAANFMTRQQAIKKLQITLPEFRKLCILHGVYPREPRKSPKGKDKTYFYAKDILHLSHDPLLSQFRAYDAWKQKITKAQHKKEDRKVKSLVENKPTYKLDHVILQRYPTFESAVEDLDDALCMISLFSVIAQNKKVRPRRVENCARLLQEWESYVAHTHCLRKVFVSIKGIYYQAEIAGRNVTWMTPLQFTYPVPKDVDLRVMLAFLEFYESLLSFILYKLYHDSEIPYPPKHFPLGNVYACPNAFEDVPFKSIQSKRKRGKAAPVAEKHDEHLMKSLSGKLNDIARADEERRTLEAEGTSMVESKEAAVEDEEMGEEEGSEDERATLFAGKKFILSREVPLRSLEFCVKACGGEATWECDEEQGQRKRVRPFDDEDATHEVVDRPSQKHVIFGRDYVMPQWVFDSINCGILLPAEEYAPGSELPAHLSPFVDDKMEGYVPEQRKHLDDLIEKAKGMQGLLSQVEEEGDDQDMNEIKAVGFTTEGEREKQFQEEMEKEAKGVSYSVAMGDAEGDSEEGDSDEEEDEDEGEHSDSAEDIDEGSAEPKMTEEEEEKKLAAIMIPSKKKKRLYQRIQYSNAQKKKKTDTLAQKRDAIAKAKKTAAKEK